MILIKAQVALRRKLLNLRNLDHLINKASFAEQFEHGDQAKLLQYITDEDPIGLYTYLRYNTTLQQKSLQQLQVIAVRLGFKRISRISRETLLSMLEEATRCVKTY